MFEKIELFRHRQGHQAGHLVSAVEKAVETVVVAGAGIPCRNLARAEEAHRQHPYLLVRHQRIGRAMEEQRRTRRPPEPDGAAHRKNCAREGHNAGIFIPLRKNVGRPTSVVKFIDTLQADDGARRGSAQHNPVRVDAERRAVFDKPRRGGEHVLHTHGDSLAEQTEPFEILFLVGILQAEPVVYRDHRIAGRCQLPEPLSVAGLVARTGPETAAEGKQYDRSGRTRRRK